MANNTESDIVAKYRNKNIPIMRLVRHQAISQLFVFKRLVVIYLEENGAINLNRVKKPLCQTKLLVTIPYDVPKGKKAYPSHLKESAGEGGRFLLPTRGWTICIAPLPRGRRRPSC